MANLVSCECVLSYPKLFEPKLRKNAKPGDKPKFGALLFVREATMAAAEYKAMVDAVIACAKDKWGEKADAMLRDGVIDLPIKKDIESQGFPTEFARYFNVECGAEYPPALLDRRAQPITDKREIYAGALVRVSMNPYAYGGPGTDYKPGIRFGLRNLQKLGDGPRLNPNDAADELKPVDGPAPGASSEDIEALM